MAGYDRWLERGDTVEQDREGALEEGEEGLPVAAVQPVPGPTPLEAGPGQSPAHLSSTPPRTQAGQSLGS